MARGSSRARKRKRRRKRGPGPVIGILLLGMLSCWLGLVKVDRQIRAVTINQSPPLWETREEGEVLTLTLLGHSARVDLVPFRAAGEELSRILRTPSAPERLFLGLREAFPLPPLPPYRPQERPAPQLPRKGSFSKEFVFGGMEGWV